MIDFTFTEEQEMFRKAAREFAETQWGAPRGGDGADRRGEPGGGESPGRGGHDGPHHPGGLGRFRAGLCGAPDRPGGDRPGVAGHRHDAAGLRPGNRPHNRSGTEAQKQKYLPGLAKGERLATVGVTEPTGGSDPTGGRTTYRKEEDDYIVNGRKCFITNAHIADTITILAKSEDDPKAFCAFVLEKSMAGFKPPPWNTKWASGAAIPESSPLKTAGCPKPSCWGKRARASK